MMQRQTIEKSSNIADAGFDADSGVLEVTFKSGKRYRYTGVNAQLFDDFMAADSKGSFLAREIRPNYEGVPVDSE
jgi:hypothetical protein